MASNVSDRPDRDEIILDLPTAQRMVPLVRHIIEDIHQTRARLGGMQLEKGRLDQERRLLKWPSRSRRYQLREEIAEAEHHLNQALAELAGLGVVVVDPEAGQIGFPTRVNGNRAYFSWRPGEDRLRHWHFPEETIRRLIPATWLAENP
jgi:hypothetical protein